jgi:ligand-binding SRPBCC domain-containing protein
MRFVRRTAMPVPAADVYAFHARPDALERLIPPWERIRVLVPPTSLAAGTRVRIRQWVGPVPIVIEAVHRSCHPGVSFVDEMVRGPFARWVHEHRFEAVEPNASWLVDNVEYELPFGALGALAGRLVERRLERMFAYRHQVTLEAMTQLAASRGSAEAGTPADRAKKSETAPPTRS